MKTFLVALIAFTSIGYAQGSAGNSENKSPRPGSTEEEPDTILVRRLEAVTWNPVRAELTWLVSVWDVARSVTQPSAREQYVIRLDAAEMEFQGEPRRFDSTEARQLRILLDMLSTYAVGATVWWDQGEGSTEDGAVIPVPKSGEDTKTKPKNDNKEEKPKPAIKGAPVPLRAPVASAPLGPVAPVGPSNSPRL